VPPSGATADARASSKSFGSRLVYRLTHSVGDARAGLTPTAAIEAAATNTANGLPSRFMLLEQFVQRLLPHTPPGRQSVNLAIAFTGTHSVSSGEQIWSKFPTSQSCVGFTSIRHPPVKFRESGNR